MRLAQADKERKKKKVFVTIFLISYLRGNEVVIFTQISSDRHE